MAKVDCKKLLLCALLLTIMAAPGILAEAKENKVSLVVVELKGGSSNPQKLYIIPPTDNSGSNPDYSLLSFHWHSTAEYWINPSNKYGFSTSAIVSSITSSANVWDHETASTVFSYKGTTWRSAGKYDGYNVISWGAYKSGVIGVTYLWYIGDQLIETDTRLNTRFRWSLSGEASKMDVRNIMTHEFGHWVGLGDLYGDSDYWLTMYGYAGYGETYKRSLGRGDILGLEYLYGS